jgi:hypothetical protein
MLSPQKAGLLQAFLGGLPPNLASRLAKAVEVDRLTDGATLPHEQILEGLRPVLSRGNTDERTPTPLRLFCRPFEDILTSAPRVEKHTGRIARTSIMPVWDWVTMKLIPRESRAYVSEIKTLLLSFRADEAKTRAIEFWTEASKAMRGALETERGRKQVEAVLKDRLAVADAVEMALLLNVGEHVLALQDKLPKPVPSFTENLIEAAHASYTSLVEAAPEAGPYAVVITMNRLARRWEALRLAVKISGKTQDTLISATDAGLVGDILLGELDAFSNTVRNTRHPRFDVDALIESIAGFAELSSAIVKEMELRRDGRWGQRLLKDRAEIATVMDGFMARLPKEVTTALPSKKPSRPMDPEKIERALRYASLVAGCKPFAAAASFAASLKNAQDEAATHLRSYSDEALWDLRSAEGDKRQILQDQFALAIELTSILCGEEEAELLRRRNRTARPAAA